MSRNLRHMGAPRCSSFHCGGRCARRHVLSALAVLVWTAALAVVLMPRPVEAEPRWLIDLLPGGPPEVIYYVDTEQRAIALTIDDGPDPETTSRILDVLHTNGAKATFFIITDHVDGSEAIIRRMIAEGHEIGNHLTQDRPSIRLDPQEFEQALREAHAVLSRFAEVRWFRPGSGWFDDEMVQIAWDKYRYRLVLGSVYPMDAQLHSPRFAATYILRSVEPGSIVVLHDVADRGLRTVDTLERVLPELRARQYQVLTLSELMQLRSIEN